jgi:hypothetical protein
MAIEAEKAIRPSWMSFSIQNFESFQLSSWNNKSADAKIYTNNTLSD